MKKTLLFLGGALLIGQMQVSAQSQIPRRQCGAQLLHDHLIAEDPTWEQKLIDQKALLQSTAEAYLANQQEAAGSAAKTTNASAIPVVFHILITSTEYAEIGGANGVQQRVDSQIAVIERDFNRGNYDSTLIPTLWKPLFANVGIHFALAHTSPTGASTPGYEVKIINKSGFQDGPDFDSVKRLSLGGLDAWNVDRYLNVWCAGFEGSTYGSLLGITAPRSQTNSSHLYRIGVIIAYNALGKRVAASDSYTGGMGSPYDKGRTLTHELGHFFEIWHTWGDDGGLCPWNTGGQDDGINDTPPETDATYGAPTYTITGGTLHDGCEFNGLTEMQPKGFASLDYMDYTDDGAMHMFTTLQAAAMAANVAAGGESDSLVLHPTLTQYPSGISQVELNTNISVSPNPTNGMVHISIDETSDRLVQISILNILGQEVKTVDGGSGNSGLYSTDLTGLSKGVYFIKCNFVTGTVTKKIVLQ